MASTGLISAKEVAAKLNGKVIDAALGKVETFLGELGKHKNYLAGKGDPALKELGASLESLSRQALDKVQDTSRTIDVVKLQNEGFFTHASSPFVQLKATVTQAMDRLQALGGSTRISGMKNDLSVVSEHGDIVQKAILNAKREVIADMRTAPKTAPVVVATPPSSMSVHELADAPQRYTKPAPVAYESPVKKLLDRQAKGQPLVQSSASHPALSKSDTANMLAMSETVHEEVLPRPKKPPVHRVHAPLHETSARLDPENFKSGPGSLGQPAGPRAK